MVSVEKAEDEAVTLVNQPKSRYSMVVLAAKRARQLKDGAPPLVEPTSTNLLTTALQEIAAGKIGIIEAIEEPDDEAPRYIRGGFLPSEYDDLSLEAETSNVSDLIGDLADEDELAGDASEKVSPAENLNSVEE